MAIILTDSFKYCPEFPDRVLATLKDLSSFEGNTEVVAAFCTRGMAQRLLSVNLPNLKVIQLFSAGYDGIDLDLVRKKGITLCNAADVYNIGMAEFVVYAMLMRAKRYHSSIKNHSIRLLRNYHYLTELYGKTVGIMGCGKIGGQIAKRLSAFDMRVIGYDANTTDRPFFEKIYGINERDVFVPQCDYIVCCIPLMKATEGLLNKDWLSQMKPDVTIINVARKSVINDADLLQFLKTHKDATAVLDMLEKIPNPITNPYRRLSNVLVLPGVTAASIESMERLHQLIMANYSKIKNGVSPSNIIVNPK